MLLCLCSSLYSSAAGGAFTVAAARWRSQCATTNISISQPQQQHSGIPEWGQCSVPTLGRVNSTKWLRRTRVLSKASRGLGWCIMPLTPLSLSLSLHIYTFNHHQDTLLLLLPPLCLSLCFSFQITWFYHGPVQHQVQSSEEANMEVRQKLHFF